MEKQRILELFTQFIAIESVSTDHTRRSQIEKGAEFLEQLLKNRGFAVKQIVLDGVPPLVVASYHVEGATQTIGIYGHYDVQPEDPISEWDTRPFVLTIQNGKMFGRGTADNKGHIIENISAVYSLIDEKKLKNNIVFVLEGEEEVGSDHLEQLTAQVKDELSKVDVWFVTDVGARSNTEPQIFNALRGIISFELRIITSRSDMHSGIYGNRVYNPAQILAYVISSMKNNENGVIQIPGFYDEIIPPLKEEYEDLVKHADTGESIMKRSSALSLPVVWGPFPGLPNDIPLSLTSKLLPSIDVNGVYSGYTGEGEKTIIPSSATAKFSCRIVAGQKADTIIKLVKQFIAEHIPKGVLFELNVQSKSEAFYTSIEHQWMKKTSDILQKVFGNEATFNRAGGSIPVAEIFQRVFMKPVILTGFTLPDENLHAPNENFDEKMFWKGITALKLLYS